MTGPVAGPQMSTPAAAAVDRLIQQAGRWARLPTRSVRRLIRLRRIASGSAQWRKRRALGRTLAAGEYGAFLSKETGFTRADSTFPGLAAAISVGRSILAAWEAAGHDPARWHFPDNEGRRDPNFNILTAADLASQPALLDFALSRPMAEALAGYLGQVPRLVQVDIRMTPPHPTGGPEVPDDNRAFHVDDRDDDCSKVRCIILLDEVGPETGPFTFVPRAATERVKRALGRRWWGSTRFADREVLPHLGPGDLNQLTGPAGTAILIDTGRCLHFGNRTTAGRRVIIMLQYKVAPEGGIPRARPAVLRPGRYDLSQFAAATDPDYRRLLLEPRF